MSALILKPTVISALLSEPNGLGVLSPNDGATCTNTEARNIKDT